MAVSRAGVGYKQPFIAGSTTSGTQTVALNVAAGLENAYGFVAVGFVSGGALTSSTFSVKWNSVAMTEALDAPLLADSDKLYLMLWVIADPAAGASEVEVTFGSLPTGVVKNMFISAVVYQDMEALDLANIGDFVETAVGSTNVTESGVTVASGVQADRVLSVHQIGFLNAFTDFTGTKVTAPLSIGGGHQILGETRGAPSVEPTVTHLLSTAKWAALGIHLDAAPLDGLGLSGSVTVPTPTFGADLYRFATPHPDRDYLVPANGTARENAVPMEVVVTANGVEMPIYIKDPDDILDYTFRWNNHLAADDEIIGTETVPSGSLRVFSDVLDEENPAVTQVWVKGGTRGVNHLMRTRFWTAKGRQHDFTWYIAGENN